MNGFVVDSVRYSGPPQSEAAGDLILFN